MAIIAKNTGGSSIAPVEAGTYAARCYSMVHVGTITEEIAGTTKTLNKVRIGWELPTEMEIFKEENGPEPRVISEEYTLSLHEKSTLRPLLESWRGKGFTDDEAAAFDVLNLIGAPCMLSVIHKKAKNGNTYAKVSGASKMPKGMECPPAILTPFIFDYDEHFNMDKVDTLPDFIKDKILSSQEFNALMSDGHQQYVTANGNPPATDGDGDLIDEDPF